MKLSALLATLTALLFGLTLSAADAPKISPKDAARLVAEGKAVLVDCREPAEWKETGVAAPAVLLSKSDFDGEQKQWKDFLAKNAGKQVLVYCRSGNRSGAVAAALAAKGVNAANAGNLKGWTDAGLPTRAADVPPVEKSKK
jgi:rhodanese-related sulfurtransferase